MFIRSSAYTRLLMSTTTSRSMATKSVFASKVLMVEPTHFFLNEETFADNKFMNKVQLD